MDWTYYLDGRVKRQYLANGSFWQTTYNDAALQATHTFYSAGSAPLATNTVGFDGRGNQVLRMDELGNPFTTGFDGLDRVKFNAGPLIVNIQTNSPGGPGGGGSSTNIYQQASTNYFDAAGLATTNVNALGESTITYRRCARSGHGHGRFMTQRTIWCESPRPRIPLTTKARLSRRAAGPQPSSRRFTRTMKTAPF